MADKRAVDYAVIGLGASLVVFFASAGAAAAAGANPPTELWAAGSAVSGALVGLLAPPPRRKDPRTVATRTTAKAMQASAAAAAQHAAPADNAAAQQALNEVGKIGDRVTDLVGGSGGSTDDAARTSARVSLDLLRAARDEAREEAANAPAEADAQTKLEVHTQAVVGAEEAQRTAPQAGVTAANEATGGKLTGSVALLIGVFAAMLALGVVLSAGVIDVSDEYVSSIKAVGTAAVALASASGGALVGLLAPALSSQRAAGASH